MLDICVDNVTVEPTDNGQWSIGYDLHNLGSESTRGFHTNIYCSKDSILDRSDRLLKTSKSVLEAGQTKEIELTLNLPGSASFGSAPDESLTNPHLIIKTDSRNRYLETDEANNIAVFPLTVAGVDLTVVGGSVVAKPDYLMVNYSIKNVGTQPVELFTRAITLDGRTVSNNTYSMNPFGQRWRQERSFWNYIGGSISVGRHILSVSVDRNGTIAESNELNNTFSWQIQKLPDNTFLVKPL